MFTMKPLNYILIDRSYAFIDATDITRKIAPRMEATHVMEVAQLLLSLLHSWGLDPHLDKVCETQLGLLKPMVSLTEFKVSYSATYSDHHIPDSSFVWSVVEGRLHVAIASNLAEQYRYENNP